MTEMTMKPAACRHARCTPVSRSPGAESNHPWHANGTLCGGLACLV